MMLAAIVSSIGAGQLMARTGRYKVLVVCGFVAVALGAYLLSRMTMNASCRTLGLDTAVMGLGLGVAMSAFTSIVQNQYPIHRLGEVSAGLQFFRIIGSTIGLAVFGTVLNNRFTSQLAVNVPAPVVKGLAAAKLDNVNALGTSQAQSGIQAIVAKAAQTIGTPVERLAADVDARTAAEPRPVDQQSVRGARRSSESWVSSSYCSCPRCRCGRPTVCPSSTTVASPRRAPAARRWSSRRPRSSRARTTLFAPQPKRRTSSR